MCENVVTASSPTAWPWFNAKKKVEEVYVQDHIHIGTKLKARLLKPSVILPLGRDHIISRGHLVELIKTVSKDQHELTECYINPKDKMNYRAVQKISSQNVTSLLRVNIANSEGTALYLDMIREVMESYTRPDLTPLERIELIWKWLFFVRIWRTFIQNSDGDYTVKNNFITSNSYACIEINAHCLIQLIILLRDREEHSLFLPWKMSSQACEQIFRILRSSLATKSGVTVFSILELQYHFRRLDMLSSTYVKLSKVISLPRHYKAAVISEEAPYIVTSLPEDYEIEAAVSVALQKAVGLAQKFSLLSNDCGNFISKTHLKPRRAEEETINGEEDEDEEDGDVDSNMIDMENDADEVTFSQAEVQADKEDRMSGVVEDLFIVSSGAIGVKQYNNVPLSEKSPFVLVGDGQNNPAIIRKSTLCWLLSSGDTKLSSDRLTRVMAGPVTQSLFAGNQGRTTRPTVEETIHVGDWCAFSEGQSVAVGRILAFSYLSGTSLKNQEYSLLSAPTKPPEKNARGLGTLCSWFSFKGGSRILQSTRMEVHGYYSVENYICTLARPIYKDGCLNASCNLREIIKLKKK